MKHLKVFNEFYFMGGTPMDHFERLCNVLNMITFDDQSHPDNNISKVTIFKELERKDGLDRLRETLDRITNKDMFEEMPYDVVLKRAVDDLFDEIDIVIGTSSDQEKKLKISLEGFMMKIMRHSDIDKENKKCEHCGTTTTKHVIGCANANQYD